MATKEEIQKQNIEESNILLSDQISLVGKLNDSMSFNIKQLKNKVSQDKISLELSNKAVAFAKNLKSEYDTVKSVQKDISKNQELQNKISRQTIDLEKTIGDKALIRLQFQKNLAKGLDNSKSKLAELRKAEEAGVSGAKAKADVLSQQIYSRQKGLRTQIASNTAEEQQYSNLKDTEKALGGITSHLNEQLKRNKNIEAAGGRTVKNMAALGTIFNKLGASGIGKIFTTASEEAKKVAYRLTDGGKNAIGILGKMEVVAKGLGAALKVALSPLALITMAIGFMQKLSRKGKEGATHMRSMSQDTMDLGRNLGVSSEKAKELAGQATAIGSSFGMTTSAAKQAAGAVYNALDGAEKVSNKTLKTFIQLNKYAGMSADNIKNIKGLSKLSGQEVSKVANAMADTAKSSIVSLKINTSMKSIMTAVGKVSNNVKLAMGGSAVGITKAVAQAKKLGLEMSQVEGIASSLLNIEDSMQKEMESELLTGKDLNLEKARAAALNNDNVGLMEELANQGITAAEYSGMNAIAQESLAGALGMSRGQMSDMLVTQKENVAENVNMVDLQKQGIDAMSSMASSQEKRAAMDEAQILALSGINAAMTRFENAALQIQLLMTPMVDLIFTPIFDLVAATAESLAGWMGTTTTIGEDGEKIYGNMELIHNVVKGIAIAYASIYAIIKAINIAKGISAFFNKDETKDALLTLQYRGLQAQQWVALQGKKASGWIAEKAHWATEKAHMVWEKVSWIGLQAKKAAGWIAEKAAKLSSMALDGASFLKSVGIAAMRAISSLSAIPVVGFGLGIAAGATVAGLAAKYMNDGAQGPVGGGGYSRTMYGPEGAISFNDKDTIVAGTNLGGSGGGGGENNSSELQRISSLLEQLLNKEGGVYIDGNKVGATVALTNYVQQ